MIVFITQARLVACKNLQLQHRLIYSLPRADSQARVRSGAARWRNVPPANSGRNAVKVPFGSIRTLVPFTVSDVRPVPTVPAQIHMSAAADPA